MGNLLARKYLMMHRCLLFIYLFSGLEHLRKPFELTAVIYSSELSYRSLDHSMMQFAFFLSLAF